MAGQAARRGTFDQRRAAAIARDEAEAERREEARAARWAAMSTKERRKAQKLSLLAAFITSLPRVPHF